MEIEDDGQWKKVRLKRKRNKDPTSPTQENPSKKTTTLSGRATSPAIIYPPHLGNLRSNQGISNNNTDVRGNPSLTLPNNNISTQVNNVRFVAKRNYSANMKGITNKKYNLLYYIKAPDAMLRRDISEIWDKEHPNTDDIILTTKQGFLLKTNQNKSAILSTLNKLVQEGKINSFKETQPSNSIKNQSTSDSRATYSVVVGLVEQEISEEEISQHLKQLQIEHRYCKRITSRATNRPTLMIRIITSCFKSSEKLLNEGVFYRHRYYPVYPSNPPAPIPQPCSRCQSFTHTRENCNSPIKCTKCGGPHHFYNCVSQRPPKCASCGSEEHSAWSLKCPRRPTKPIEGIPNAQIKPLNKKTREMDATITKNSKIHSPVTIHDMIVDTYIYKLNKDNKINREELIAKLRKRFVSQYAIDTIAHFSGNRLYILMFDLENPTTSPTQPIQGNNNIQVHVDA